MNVVARILTCAILMLPATAAAQTVISPRPGGAGPELPSHIRSQLWPERALSPTEAELKRHVMVLRDSLTRIDATKALIDRQARSGASAAMVRSAARTLAADCSRAGRTTAPAVTFAADLTTSDTKWGDPAVRDWRSGLAALTRELGTCDQAASGLIAGASTADSERLLTVSNRASRALIDYRRTEQALLATLKIDIYPSKGSR